MKCPICSYGDPDNLLAQARRLAFRGEHERALEALTTAVRLDPSRGDIWYEKAKYECRRGLLEEAIISLELACTVDGSYVTFAEYRDWEFKPLRTDPRFRKLAKWRNDELKRLITKDPPGPFFA